MGEYFGGSVLGFDITGDGVDELIVGAPLSHITGFKLSPGDHGKVYIYINDGQVSYHLYFTQYAFLFFLFSFKTPDNVLRWKASSGENCRVVVCSKMSIFLISKVDSEAHCSQLFIIVVVFVATLSLK